MVIKINRLIDQPTNPQSINQPTINQPINQPINQSVNQSINQSINQSVSQPTNQPINQSTKQLIIYCVCSVNFFTIAILSSSLQSRNSFQKCQRQSTGCHGALTVATKTVRARVVIILSSHSQGSRFLFFGLRYTEHKLKNIKKGRPGNEVI